MIFWTLFFYVKFWEKQSKINARPNVRKARVPILKVLISKPFSIFLDMQKNNKHYCDTLICFKRWYFQERTVVWCELHGAFSSRNGCSIQPFQWQLGYLHRILRARIWVLAPLPGSGSCKRSFWEARCDGSSGRPASVWEKHTESQTPRISLFSSVKENHPRAEQGGEGTGAWSSHLLQLDHALLLWRALLLLMSPGATTISLNPSTSRTVSFHICKFSVSMKDLVYTHDWVEYHCVYTLDICDKCENIYIFKKEWWLKFPCLSLCCCQTDLHKFEVIKLNF